VVNLAATPSMMSRRATPVSGMLHIAGANSSARIDAALRRVMETTTTPIRRREITARISAMGLALESKNPIALIGNRIAGTDYVVRLKGHGYWHRDRPYAPAGWEGKAARSSTPIPIRPTALGSDFAQVASATECESQDIRRRKKSQDEARLRAAWAVGGADVTGLLESSLRFILRYTEVPMNMADCQVALADLDIPTAIRSKLKYNIAKNYSWMDRIHKEGFWMKGRPGPEGTPSPDWAIRDAMQDLLTSVDQPLAAEEILAHLRQSGLVVSLSGADELPITRKHLHEIDRVRSKPSLGFWIPKLVRAA
jgi:hypothetical protein